MFLQGDDRVQEVSLRVSIDHLLEGVQIVGFDWTYLFLNHTAARQSRRSADELLGRTMMACYPDIETTELFAALDRVMRTRRLERMLNELLYPDGERRWFEIQIEPVPDGICIFSLDVTERLSAELQLQQAHKMETIGQLAGGIAHDFNNILTAILGYAELITDQIGPDKPIGRDIHEIVVAAERAASLTRQLLAFSRKQSMTRVPLSLNAMVRGLEPMLRRLISENVGICTSLDPEVSTVFADETQLEQVLINLVVNARDAMVDGGVVTIATRNAMLDADYSATHAEASRGEFAVLSVRDTGTGMTPEIRARIFEPFFTTKERGRGTGLGLAAVHGIIKQLGGSISVDSEPGRGTAFEIYLPKTNLPLASAGGRARRARAVGTETILLVEDEAGVRGFARTVLQRHGYSVIETVSAEEALAAMEKRSDEIDLLLTDVILSGMDGTQLARAVCEADPQVRVLFMSGYAEPFGSTLSQGAELLEKPFTAQALLERVRQALD